MSVSQDHGDVPYVVIPILSRPHSFLIAMFVIRVKRQRADNAMAKRTDNTMAKRTDNTMAKRTDKLFVLLVIVLSVLRFTASDYVSSHFKTRLLLTACIINLIKNGLRDMII
jgi:hypothetical protein